MGQNYCWLVERGNPHAAARAHFPQLHQAGTSLFFEAR
jgi:hypothetical protein